MTKNGPLIVIVGETASGKSALALELAQQFNGEIICADSSTVRREANIGTAKPTPEEQALVPHHLLDVVGPDETFTVAQFKQLANQAIKDITARGRLPIIVGGAGLYIDSVIYDYSFRDQADPKLRKELNSLTKEELLVRIEQMGISIEGTDTDNPRRLIRLIETKGQAPIRGGFRDNTLMIGLKTDREMLNERIERRVDKMLESGLKEEVQRLVTNYGWGCEALKGVGYSQWEAHFNGVQTVHETRQKIVSATISLAKRQRTWFNRNKSIHWFITPVNRPEVVDTVTTFLSD